MAIFAGLFLKKPVAYWLDELEKAGVPSGPINNFEQVFADPHVQSRGMRVKVEHPFEHALSLIRNSHHLLRHAGERIIARRRCSASIPRKCWRRSAMTTAKVEALKAQKIV